MSRVVRLVGLLSTMRVRVMSEVTISNDMFISRDRNEQNSCVLRTRFLTSDFGRDYLSNARLTVRNGSLTITRILRRFLNYDVSIIW